MMRRHLSWLALLCGLACLAYAGYIPAKAWVAQRLLDHAWERRLAGEQQVRPWPWADTQPQARISQLRLGIDQIVLAGASGRVLAFGPGHVTGSARLGAKGNIVLSGHRDTHFRWLKNLAVGDELVLHMADGRQRHYRVDKLAVHHESEVELLDPHAGDQLRLLTCYPFDALDPGTPERFVVTAYPVRWISV